MRFLCRALLLIGVIWSNAALGGTLAQFRTVLGTIEVELLDFDKPATVQNFIRYIDYGLYGDMFFHRWATNFVIQGGGFYTANRRTTNVALAAVPTFPPVTNEFSVGPKVSNLYGTLAMARQSGKTNSATSQWFFNLKDNDFLDGVDGGFTVFGKVVGGTNVLNRFLLTSTNNGIFILPLRSPLNELPVLARKATFEDFVYVDITLLRVQVTSAAEGGHEISWLSVSNQVNRVEFTTQTPPVWKELMRTNGTGQLLRVVDRDPAADRFYRVTIAY